MQNETSQPSDIHVSSEPLQPDHTNVPPTNLDTPSDSILHPAPHVDAVKHPDWSKWKTSKAGQIDDKFSDFQILKPNLTSVPTSSNLADLDWSSLGATSSTAQTGSMFASFQSLSPTPSVTGTSNTVNVEIPKTANSEEFPVFGELQSSSEGIYIEFSFAFKMLRIRFDQI